MIKDIEIYDLKSKQTLYRPVIQRNMCLYIQKNQYCVLWKKNRKDSLLNGVGEIEAIFKNVKNKINEDNLSRRIYRPRNEKQ